MLLVEVAALKWEGRLQFFDTVRVSRRKFLDEWLTEKQVAGGLKTVHCLLC